MTCAIQVGLDDMIYIPSFMTIGSGIQVILRFCLSNFGGCKIGNSDGRDLQSAPLKWLRCHDNKESRIIIQYGNAYTK
jgi:hypothetical protein